MTSAAGQKHLVLLGAGLAHLHLLAHLRHNPLQGVQVTLITPKPRLIYSGMLAGFVAGRHTLDECAIPLEPLVQPLAAQGFARWFMSRAMALDAQARTVLLDDGQVVNFDWLSLCNEPLQDRDALALALPGAREHGLFVHPLDAFCALWPRVPELAARQPLRVAVIGGLAKASLTGQDRTGTVSDAATGSPPATPINTQPATQLAIELALAIRRRLPGSAVTLITGGAPLGLGESPSLQQCLAQALRQRNVTVLADSATQIQSGEILLSSGARLACDVPVIATGPNTPAWLAKSGLAVDSEGRIAVDTSARSTSHPHVFAAGQARAENQFASPGSAQAEGARLTANLAATVAGQPMRASAAARHALKLISCGDGHAVAAWGPYSAQGRWAGWLKNRQDLAVAGRYRDSGGLK